MKKSSFPRFRPQIWFCLVTLLWCGLALAQINPRWSNLADTVFTQLGKEQGLPHLSTKAVVQDRHGFIWIGTEGGLARWDGYRFQIYQPDPKDANSLPDNNISVLHIDRREQLWVGSPSGGLARYDAQGDRFIRIEVAANPGQAGIGNKLPSPPSNNISHASVWAIANDDGDGIWVATNSGLNHVVPNEKTTLFQHDPSNPAGLPVNRTQSLLRDGSGRLWIGTESGLAVQNEKRTGFISIILPTHDNAKGSNKRKVIPSVTSLAQSSDGKIWVGTLQHGSFVIEGASASATGTVRPLIDTGESGDLQGGARHPNAIFSIVEVRPGEVWLGSFGDGLIAVDSTSLQTRHIRHDIALPTSLASNRIRSILLDRSGLAWVATGNGISRHDPQQRGVLNLFGDPHRQGAIQGGTAQRGETQSTHLTDPEISGVSSMPDGSLWLGLIGGGLNIIDPNATSVRWLAADALHPETALPSGRVWTMRATPDGKVYIATAQGLYQSDLAGRQVQRVNLSPRNVAAPVLALRTDSKGLWIGGNDGLWRVESDTKSGSPMRAVRALGTEVLDTQRIRMLEQATDGTLWIGTVTNGLYRYDPASHALSHAVAEAADPSALAHNFVADLLFDSKGRLWVATQGGGINLLPDPKANGIGPFQRISKDQGLPNDLVNKLLEDAGGNIWASTDAGMAVIDLNTLAVRTLGVADGVAFDTYFSNSGTKSAQGELVFGGTGGLTVVRPEHLQTWQYRPPIVVTNIQLGGKTIVANGFNLAQSQVSLTIRPEANSFAIEFAALDYSAPQQNRYSYRLEGYDKEWHVTDPSRRLASYTNLPPGDYRLHLRGSNRNGVWSEPNKIVLIRVLPAWFEAWWFRVTLILIAVLLILGIIHGRTRYLLQRQRAQDEVIQLRTSELQQKQNELMQNQEELIEANKGLALSVDTLRQLGDIGRELTCHLDRQILFQTLYKDMEILLKARTVLIYRSAPAGAELELAFGRDFGVDMPTHSISIDARDSFVALSARERKSFLQSTESGAIEVGTTPQLTNGHVILSALYAPLIIDNRLLGVMSIQSDQAFAYGVREELIFQTVVAYAAIAMSNADAYLRLEQAQERIVEQEKLAALGSLVAGVAHELNTPIGNCVLAASCLQDDTAKLKIQIAEQNLRRSDINRFCDNTEMATGIMLRSLGSAATLINSFKQISVDRSTEQRREFKFVKLLSDILLTVNTRIREANHTITIDVPDALHLDSYPGSLGQVILCLIDNALLHAFKSGRSGEIYINVSQPTPQRVQIHFYDNGVGISSENVKRVFDPFFTTKLGQGGSGLGLYIAYNIVNSVLNGEITIDSKLGEGTHFYVDLPLVVE